MTLPTIFAALTSATGADLDNNFAALGAISTIPCGVTGTNALSLAPLADTPTVSAYQNYMAFSGIAAAANTGAVTAGVNALPSLPVYKDTPSGPAALVGAEIQAGSLITLTYDAALGAGGGFHVQTGINGSAGTYLPLTGGTLTGSMSGTSSTLSGVQSVAGLNSSGLVNGVSLTGVSIAAAGNLSGASVTIGGGTSLKSVLSTTIASIVFTSILPNTSQDQVAVFAGLSLGDTLAIGLPSLTSVGLGFNAFASAAGTVTLRALNITANTVAAVTLAGVRFTALKF